MPTIQERNDTIDQALAETKDSTLAPTLADPINVLIILGDEEKLKQCPPAKLLAAIEAQEKEGSEYFKIVKPQTIKQPPSTPLLPWEIKEEKKSVEAELLEHGWKSININEVQIIYDASIIPLLVTKESVENYAAETEVRLNRV